MDEWRAFRINHDSFVFTSFAYPTGASAGHSPPMQLLANTALHILAQVIHVILALPESDIEHELSLRSALEPEAAKLEALERSRVQQMNNLSSINAIARKAVRVPREYALCLPFSIRANISAKTLRPGSFCGFGFLEGSRDFQLLFFCKVAQLAELRLD